MIRNRHEEVRRTIDHFILMRLQSESLLRRSGLSVWHRGLRNGEMRAYKYCIEYLVNQVEEGIKDEKGYGPRCA